MRRYYVAAVAAALLVSFGTLCAQETSGQEVSPKPSFKGFVTNGFWDNWEITVGGGTGAAFFSHTSLGEPGKYFQGFGELSVTKWLHPVVGARAHFQGGTYATVNSALETVKWPHLAVHVDGMINLSNWIGGYKEDRIYYAIPYAGMGVMATNFTDASQNASGTHGAACNFVFAYGLQNRFRVSPSIDINLELKGLLGMSSLSPVRTRNQGAFLHMGNVSVGVTYRFGKRDFVRGAAGYTLDDIESMKREAEKAALEAEAAEAELRNQIAEAEAETKAAESRLVDAEREIKELRNRPVETVAAPTDMVFFDYGYGILNNEGRTRLDVLAKEILAGPADHVYEITGYADFQTGSKSHNEALSLKRAKAVNDYLVEAGIPAERLKYRGTDAGEQPFEAECNQVVIIR